MEIYRKIFNRIKFIARSKDIAVSVIIPAYNAEKTLRDTLKSLQVQTHPKWEAIVIDDGSSDATAVIASRFAQQDRRIRFVSQQNSGPCVARNVGIRMAQFDWLLFLDSDDWIAPTHLQRLTETLLADPRLDGVHCGCVYVAPDGTLSNEMYGDDSPDLFPTAARHCVFHICSCVVRKALVEEVGGWDSSICSCEDWDLWQRIARAGARFGAVKEVLAYYRMQPNSLSRHGNQFFVDAMRVLAQGHSSDRRVPNPDPRYREGQPPTALPLERLYMASWVGGLILGKGEDARPLLKLIKDVPVPDLSPYGVAECLFESVPLSTCQLPSAWPRLWLSVERCMKDFLVALEALSKVPGLAKSTGTILERKILELTEITDPLTLGTYHKVGLEITGPLADIRLPEGVERLFGDVSMGGVKFGKLELPVIDGLVSHWVLEDAIAAEFAGLILNRFFEHAVHPEREVNEPDQIDWKVFWQQLWGDPDWAAGHDNDFEAEKKSASTKTVNLDKLMVEICDELPDLSIRYPEVKIGFAVGGVPVGVVTIPVKNNLLKAATLKVALSRFAKLELCRACVREALVGKSHRDPTSLRSRLAQAAQARAHHPVLPTYGLVSPQTVVLGGRPGTLGTSVSRRALLPREAAHQLVEMARIAGEPISKPPHPGNEPDRVLYAPEQIEYLFNEPLNEQQSSGSSIFPAPNRRNWGVLNPALGNRALLTTVGRLKQAYAGKLHKLRISLPPRVSRLLWKFLIFRTPALPILLYHRVAPHNLSSNQRYCLTPEAFEKQLRYLRNAGFYSVALNDWLNAMITGRPLPGRALAFTFDGGYQDFYEYAFPLLKSYGFNATVFLVTDFIGGSNQWNEAYREKVRLMGWEEIRHLKTEGISFGSHSVSHRSLISLSPAEIVHEAAQSRALLERELGIPVKTFAYPYGYLDTVVQHLIGACGYTIALSNSFGLGRLRGMPLGLPRIEIKGSSSYQDFINKFNYGLLYSLGSLLAWKIRCQNEPEDFL
jgi:peptidoglycan/xylan/chitin deacetylase (PgdA/CDA1 family)